LLERFFVQAAENNEQDHDSIVHTITIGSLPVMVFLFISRLQITFKNIKINLK